MQTLQVKQENAKALAEARAKLTPAQQIKELDKRLGIGKGAVRERARLAKQLEAKAEKAEKPTKQVEAKAEKPAKQPK